MGLIKKCGLEKQKEHKFKRIRNLREKRDNLTISYYLPCLGFLEYILVHFILY